MEYSIDTALEILEQTPKTLKSFLWELSEEWLFSNEGKATWSPFDVVGHLIHGENTDWVPRMNIILSHKEDKTFKPYDRFAQFENSKGKNMHDLLEEFERLRNKNITYVKSLHLTENELALKGNHPSLGEVTLKELLATWTTHDLGHIVQISRVMAKQYKAEVGPWTKFISVLNK